MLQGNLVHLTAVEQTDLQQLMDWRNNPDFRKYFREYRELNMEMQLKWFNQKVLADPTTIMFSIRRNSDDQLLGCCGFVYVNWIHRHADLSLYIGWDGAYIDQEGYAKESCSILFSYGFNEINLNKIWTEIYEFDFQKKSLYDDIGLSQDGLLRKNYFYDGKWWDSRIMSILADDFRRQK